MKNRSIQHRESGGFSLVEVALALGVAAFCLITLVGLVPAGVNTDQSSLEQTAAAGIATAVMADLRATAKTASASPRFGLKISASAGTLAQPETVYLAEDGSATGAVGAAPAANARYRVSLAFTDPPAAPGKGPTGVRLLVTWPAAADANPAQVPKNYADSLEVVTALDRN